MKRKDFKLSILIITSVIMPFSIITLNYSILQTSEIWDLSDSPIHIDDSNPNSNWIKMSSENDWCSGSGTWNDPYIIHDVIINSPSSETCIEIMNSNAPFIIQNCRIYNTLNGIVLNYVMNGIISNNKCSFLSSNGILLFESSNITLLKNNINHNYVGIYLKNSNFNKISDCSSNYNFRGVHLESSDNNIIEYNQFSHNTDWGIAIPFGGNDGSNNVIRRNLIQFNGEFGIYIQDTEPSYNLIYSNYFVLNGIDAYDHGTNTEWNSGNIGNYWYGYTGIDQNDDGIGDTPYNFGTGIDLYPIYRERPVIEVSSPKNNASYITPPGFILKISGLDIDSIWYTINLGDDEYIINNKGNINPSIWYNLPNGNILIRFYVNDTYGIFSYSEVVVIKQSLTATDILMIALIMAIIAIISISFISVVIWRKKFHGRAIFIKDPAKLKLIKKDLLNLGSKFDHLYINEIAERCGVLDRTIVSVLKEMINNKEIYAKYYKQEKLIVFDQQLITEQIDLLLEIYRKWEEKEFGKSK